MNATALSTGFRSLFYVITPEESSFASLGQVPDFVTQASPYFAVLIFLEAVVLHLQGKPAVHMEDSLSSISAGIVYRLQYLLKRATELTAYSYVWENWRLLELPWNSAWTWWLCLVGVDFGYYWVHRCAHEVNFMWAAHQTHHSSEEYNLTTALRQSAFQNYSSWIFYLPLALIAPPSLFYVHVQLNLLYQFWIHTEVIDNLGPLEYILNTPSHHRVHHGRNRYCIDKNYGGTLIIFDRLFGTFAAEKESDPVVYGLVHTLESRNPFYVQICHWQYILQTAWSTPGLAMKLRVLLNGPGWSPGKPRLGHLEDIPDIHYPQPKYTTQAPMWYDAYVFVHFIVVMVVFELLASYSWLPNMPIHVTLCGIAYILLSLTALGSLYDARWYGPALELARCLGSAALLALVKLWPLASQDNPAVGAEATIAAALTAGFAVSASVWLCLCMVGYSTTARKNKVQQPNWPWPASGYSTIKGKTE